MKQHVASVSMSQLREAFDLVLSKWPDAEIYGEDGVKRPTFGRRRLPPDPRLIEQRQLHAMGEEWYATVAGQVRQLPSLQADYPDHWPPILDLTAINTGMADVRKALDIYAERLATATEPLPDNHTQTLREIVGRLHNSRDIIAGNIADLVIDKLSNSIVRKAEER